MGHGLLAQNSTGVLVRSDSTALKLVTPDASQGEAVVAVTTDPLDLWLWKNGLWYLARDLRTVQRLWNDDGDGSISYGGRIDVQDIGVSSILGKYVINDNGTFGSVNTIPSTDVTGLEQYENIWRRSGSTIDLPGADDNDNHVFGSNASISRYTLTGGVNPYIQVVDRTNNVTLRFTSSNTIASMGTISDTDLEIRRNDIDKISLKRTGVQMTDYGLGYSKFDAIGNISSEPTIPANDISLDATNFDQIGTTYTDVQIAMQRINDLLGTQTVILTNGQIAFGDSNNEVTSNNNFTYDANSSGLYHQGVGTGVFYQQTNNQNNVIMRYGVTSIEGYVGTLLDDPMELRQSGSPRITLTEDSKIQFNDFNEAGSIVCDAEGNLSTIGVDSAYVFDITSSTSSTINIRNRSLIQFDSNTESDYQVTRFQNPELGHRVTFYNRSNQTIQFVANETNVNSLNVKFRTIDGDTLNLTPGDYASFEIIQAFNILEGHLVSTTAKLKTGVPVTENNFYDFGAIATNQATLGNDFLYNPDKTGIICQCNDATDSILGMPDLGDGRVITLHNSGSMACLLVGESAGATDVEFGGGNSTLGPKRSKKLQQHGKGAGAYWSLFTE